MPDAGTSDDNRGGYDGQQTVRMFIGGTDYGEVPAQITYVPQYDFNFSDFSTYIPEKSPGDYVREAFQGGISWLQKPLFLGQGIDETHPEYSRVQSELEKLRQEAQGAFGIVMGFPASRVGNIVNDESKAAEQLASKVELSNAFPVDGKFARVMSRQQAEQILENGGGKLARGGEAWITAVEDLREISTIEGAAKKLTLVDENGALRLSGDAVLEFRLKNMSGINSPYNRPNPGFVNGGRTGAGAREWLIPSEMEITDISIRYLE